MAKNNPLISCIIPTFNRAHLIKEAIESIIAQTYENWELIIVDDGSQDETESVISSYIKRDRRIKYYKNLKKGQSSARNFGFLKSSGDYIAYLDDDDVSLPIRFESQIKVAQKSGSQFIVSGYQVRQRNTESLISEHRLDLKGLGAGFPSRWLLSRELLKKAGGFKEEFPSMEEIELSYRLALYETFVLHSDIVTIIYRTSNSVSARPDNSLMGKEMLMKNVGTQMHPIEAASWYYTIATTNYLLGNKEKAINYFKLTFQRDNRFKFKIAKIISKLAFFFSFSKFARKQITKIFIYLGQYDFPVLVEHKHF